jgi:hypothetical protein
VCCCFIITYSGKKAKRITINLKHLNNLSEVTYCSQNIRISDMACEEISSTSHSLSMDYFIRVYGVLARWLGNAQQA